MAYMIRTLFCLSILISTSAFAAEVVEITYNDGKKEKGELIEQSVDKVVLRQKMADNNIDFPIPWTRIQSISNGLTRETVLKKWKETNKDKLCPDCNGDRQVSCKKCNGSGSLTRIMAPCAACEGTGSTACKTKGCDHGKIPCTGNCLKLSEGKWEKGDENLLWRKFTYPGGWNSWSERHLGEVIEIQNGKPVNIGKCKLCDGTTTLKCKACEGTGKTVCAVCKGAKEIAQGGPAPKCPDCQGGKLSCPTCKGSGLKP